MSRQSLDVYAERARLIEDDTVASGRRPIDRAAMPGIRAEVLGKLSLGGEDTLLDIGAGIGMLTVPLSYFVKSVTAVDHPDVLARMPSLPNIEKLPGDFLTVDMGERRYSRALAYSMAHYLGSQDDILALVDKTIELLSDGGLFLLGDLPNDDYRVRSAGTAPGQRLVLDLGMQMLATEEDRKRIESVLTEARDVETPQFADPELLSLVGHVRAMGHHAWLVRQGPGLPFAHGREDLLIQKLLPAPARDLFVTGTVDANGEQRYIGLAIREIHPADCDLLYAWSQEPVTRAASIRTETFTIEQHRQWFGHKLDEMVAGHVRWYILEEMARSPIGVVRYERVVAGRPLWTGGPVAPPGAVGTEVSVAIIPAARGYGLGTLLLHRTEQHALRRMTLPLIALIRPGNNASLRAFARAGYAAVGEEQRMGVRLMRYEKKTDANVWITRA